MNFLELNSYLNFPWTDTPVKSKPPPQESYSISTFIWHVFFLKRGAKASLKIVCYYARKSGSGQDGSIDARKAQSQSIHLRQKNSWELLNKVLDSPLVTRTWTKTNLLTVGTCENQFKNPEGNLTQIGSEQSGLAKASLKIPRGISLKSVQNGRGSRKPV